MSSPLDQRPILVALAGPNGAGKTTFYHSHLKAAGLRLVNADVVARELNIDAYQAARLTAAIVKNWSIKGKALCSKPYFLTRLETKFRSSRVHSEGATQSFSVL